MAGLFLAAIAALAAGDSAGPALRERVDLIEVNHFHDEDGRRVLDQVIFYDWSPGQRRFLVRAWRLLESPAQWPLRGGQRSGWEIVWHDEGLLRAVRAPAFRETWTQVDPERTNRRYLKQDQRFDLRYPRPPQAAGGSSQSSTQ